MFRWIAAVAVACAVAGCGSRCARVEAEYAGLRARAGAANRGADVRVRVPLARANALVEELLRAEPLTVPLAVPDLGPLGIDTADLTATAREVRVQPGAPDKLRFAVELAIRDGVDEVTTLSVVAEVTPALERTGGAAELVVGFGARNLLAVTPRLGPDPERALRAAIVRRVPAAIRDRVPGLVLDAAVRKLETYLTGAAYTALQKTLLVRLGELTRLRLRLPDVPVARVAITSTERALVVEIATDLAVRRGLGPDDAGDDEVSVRIAGSAAAELVNWGIDQGHLPRWYTRSIEPRATGEYRPYFDYVPGAGHPIKIAAFQQRGGCSYFRVAVRARVALEGDRLNVTAVDRELEGISASPALEVGAWVKFLLFGWIDESKRVAAHTRLALGARSLETRVIGAALDHDELRFALRFTASR